MHPQDGKVTLAEYLAYTKSKLEGAPEEEVLEAMDITIEALRVKRHDEFEDALAGPSE